MEYPNLVECPICGWLFKDLIIESHSAHCTNYSPSSWSDDATGSKDDTKKDAKKRQDIKELKEHDDGFGSLLCNTRGDEDDKKLSCPLLPNVSNVLNAADENQQVEAEFYLLKQILQENIVVINGQAEGEVEHQCPICLTTYPEYMIHLHANYCLEQALPHTPRTESPQLDDALHRLSLEPSIECPEDMPDDESQEEEEEENPDSEEGASGPASVQDEEGVPCPLCQCRFPEDVLEDHAALCGEPLDVIAKFIKSEPLECPICKKTFPTREIFEHAAVCDGWKNTEEGKAKSKVDEEEETANSQRILDRLIQNCAGKKENTEDAVATTDNSLDSSLVDCFRKISSVLGNDSNWMKKMEEMWKNCDGNPFKFVESFIKMNNSSKGVLSIGPNSLVFDVIKFATKMTKSKKECQALAAHAKSLLVQFILPWVESIGGWKVLLTWLGFIVAICGVFYLAYLAYTKFREWRQNKYLKES